MLVWMLIDIFRKLNAMKKVLVSKTKDEVRLMDWAMIRHSGEMILRRRRYVIASMITKTTRFKQYMLPAAFLDREGVFKNDLSHHILGAIRKLEVDRGSCEIKSGKYCSTEAYIIP